MGSSPSSGVEPCPASTVVSPVYGHGCAPGQGSHRTVVRVTSRGPQRGRPASTRFARLRTRLPHGGRARSRKECSPRSATRSPETSCWCSNPQKKAHRSMRWAAHKPCSMLGHRCNGRANRRCRRRQRGRPTRNPQTGPPHPRRHQCNRDHPRHPPTQLPPTRNPGPLRQRRGTHQLVGLLPYVASRCLFVLTFMTGRGSVNGQPERAPRRSGIRLSDAGLLKTKSWWQCIPPQRN